MGVVAAQPNYTPYSIVTYAGYANQGSFDGVGTAAQFDHPSGLATDGSGNVFVADTNNHTIRKITPAGSVTTVGGTPATPGSIDGFAASAQFASPAGVAVDVAGNLYVADTGNHTIRKISASGVVSTVAGVAGSAGKSDGIGAAARFDGPRGIAVDASGTVFVADTNNNALRKISAGGVVTTVLGPGSNDGAIANFGVITSVAVDPSGSLYLIESSRFTSTVFRLSRSGTLTALAAFTVPTSRFPPPFFYTLAVDVTGRVYIADNINATALVVAPDGLVTTLATLPSAWGIAVDGNGNVFVAENSRSTIVKISPGGSPVVLAGATTLGGVHDTDGIGRDAMLVLPWGIAVDAQGVVYVADESGPTVRKILPGGIVTTLAGLGGHTGGSQDGVGTDARFLAPYGLALDATGTVYVADADNFTIRKITPDGTVTTWAGATGVTGSADGVGSSARFARPIGVAIDVGGNVYVGDYFNHTIRKISPDAVVTTLAGLAGSAGSADGMGSAARFDGPTGIAVDSSGNVYVSDSQNFTIRKITPAGVVSTLAGTVGVAGSADGTGANAQFHYASGLAVDRSGTLFVSDGGNNTIRQITPAGVVTTVAGLPGAPSITLDGVGSAARLNGPAGIAVDANGNLFIADSFNYEIRIGSARPPAIIVSPGDAMIANEGGSTLSVAATGSLNFQWYLNGAAIAGATAASYAVSYGGSYTVAVSNAAGSVISRPALLTAPYRMANLSTRAQVQSGVNVMIVGFAVRGLPGTTKQVLIRGIGPALAQFGVGGPLAQPTMSVYDSAGGIVATNTGWGRAPVVGDSLVGATAQVATPAAMQGVGAFSLPAGSADSALVATLPPGNYTVPVAGVGGAVGTGLGEIYELNGSDSAVLTNVSSRVTIEAGTGTGIVGFVVSGTRPAGILIRAVGPGLGAFGVTGPLMQPSLTLYDSGGQAIATNTGWQNALVQGPSSVVATVRSATASAMAEVGAFALTGGSADSAMVATLPAGTYSAVVSSANSTSGTALVEVYGLNLPH